MRPASSRTARAAPRAQSEQDAVVRARSSVRTAWIGALVVLVFVGLGGKAAAIMLVADPQLESQARMQFEQSVLVEGRRGDLLDRDLDPLATTVDLPTLHADPSRLDPSSARRVAEQLAPILSLDETSLAARLVQPGRRDIVLARHISPAQAEAARALAPRTVLWTTDEPRRYYPGRSDAAHLLGVTGRSGGGMAGVERSLDSLLRGETIKYVLWRDRKGRRVTPDVPHAEEGNSVVLTLDRDMQRLAEAAIAGAADRTGAEAVHAVVMDVRTGEILALANWPTVNPNNSSRIELEPFKNRAALDAFEPGSVMKPFIVAVALDEGLVSPDSPVDCEGGSWSVGNKTIHDDHPHGVVPVSDVIKYSSNIGSAKLALRLGGETVLGALRGFGFGRATGLDLPGETRGALFRPGSVKPIELATTAYGHGMSASSVQLTSAMAALGNHGVRMRPILVREVRDRHGDVARRFEPEADRRVVEEEAATAVVGMMEAVTEEGGTGTRARVPGYRVAGKTGTAWKHVSGGYSSTARIASFVGLAPAEAPRVAISVVVDTPTKGSRYGGIAAAPAFAEIAGGAMRLLGVAPSIDPSSSPSLDDEPEPDHAAAPVASPELTWEADGRLRAPDLSGLSMREALVTVEGAGLKVSLTGSGRVSSQAPPPGSPLSSGDEVALVLR